MPTLIPLIVLCSLISLSLPTQQSSEDEYVTGMTVIGKTASDSSCPILVWKVPPGTPAANAGIRPGDRLQAINGQSVVDIEQARSLLHAAEPVPIALELTRKHRSFKVTVSRIKLSASIDMEGWKSGPGDTLFPKDASEAEMQRVSKITREPPEKEKVFPIGHYPSNLEIYYPGFEVFTWKDSPMTVGGMEDGRAKAAGVHYGDPIVSVNGTSPYGKSMPDLQRLFSSPTPTGMTLIVNRDGEIKTFKFELAKASEIARLNHKRLYNGRMIPSVIPDHDLHCWEK